MFFFLTGKIISFIKARKIFYFMQLLPQSSWYSEIGTKTIFWVDGFFKMVLEII